MSPAKTSASPTSRSRKNLSTSLGGKALELYRLPPAVYSANNSWKATTKPIIITCALFSLVSLELLRMAPPLGQQPTRCSKALRIVGYASFLLNLGGTASGVLILDNVGTLPVDAIERALSSPASLPARVYAGNPLPKDLLRRDKQMELLRQFGMDNTFTATTSHLLACFALGIMAMFIQISLWVCSNEEPFVASSAIVFLFIGTWGFLNTIISSFRDAVSNDES